MVIKNKEKYSLIKTDFRASAKSLKTGVDTHYKIKQLVVIVTMILEYLFLFSDFSCDFLLGKKPQTNKLQIKTKESQ